jgi:hypothetical protein
LAMRKASGSERRRKRQATRKAERAEFVAEHPTPYEGWDDERPRLRDRIIRATTAMGDAGALATWSKGKLDRARALSADDLAVALFAVERVGAKGLNYGQLDLAFRRCVGVGCHRSKATAVLAELVRLGLARRIGNYSVGARGNQYATTPTTAAEVDEFIRGL